MLMIKTKDKKILNRISDQNFFMEQKILETEQNLVETFTWLILEDRKQNPEVYKKLPSNQI